MDGHYDNEFPLVVYAPTHKVRPDIFMITIQDIHDFETMLAGRADYEIVTVTVGRLRSFVLLAKQGRCERCGRKSNKLREAPYKGTSLLCPICRSQGYKFRHVQP